MLKLTAILNMILKFVIFLLLSLPLFARIWTDSEGRKIDAELIDIKEHTIVIKLRAEEKEIPIEWLSEKDQKFISEIRKEIEKERTISEIIKKNAPSSLLPPNPEPEKAIEEESNWDAPWPSSVKGPDDLEIDIFEENKDEKRFIYHSPHYSFTCDVRLSKTVVKRFSVMFEATREFMRQLPINSRRAHQKGSDKRLKILLFEKREDYIKNGGPPSSAGVYYGGRRNTVMVPLTSLGVQKVGSGYMVDHKKGNKTLPHELAHQLTDSEYYSSGSRGWFSEGLAEYVGVCPYRSGRFNVKANLRAIKDYVCFYGKDDRGGRGLGKEIHAPDLKTFMLQDYESFKQSGNFNYGLGLLITTYFIHMDDDGSRTALTAFLKALKEGKRGSDSLEVLLAGRNFEDLEKDIARKWRGRGVKLHFE